MALSISIAALVILGTLLILRESPFHRNVPREDEKRQHVRIVVRDGYDPAQVELRCGIPVTLEFYRDEDNPCSERVILDGFNRNVYLAPFESTEIDLLPNRTGTFEFACGMGMMHGRIIVKASNGAGG